MAHRTIGQERFTFSADDKRSELDALLELIYWREAEVVLSPISDAVKGEQGWPPLCLLKALLLARWYDLSDVKLAEALDDRASFRRFCGFSKTEPTPERTAFVRFRRAFPSCLGQAGSWASWILAKNCSKRSRLNSAPSRFL